MSERRIVVDPVTRIEGHLRVQATLGDDGRIADSMSTGTMCARPRGHSQGPRPARRLGLRRTHLRRLHGHSRPCGRAQRRGRPRDQDSEERQHHAQPGQCHALRARPSGALLPALRARLGRRARRSRPIPAKPRRSRQKISPSHPLASVGYFRDVQNRLKKFVASGQLGIFKIRLLGPSGHEGCTPAVQPSWPDGPQ